MGHSFHRGGNDVINTGTGHDVLVLDGPASEYTLTSLHDKSISTYANSTSFYHYGISILSNDGEVVNALGVNEIVFLDGASLERDLNSGLVRTFSSQDVLTGTYATFREALKEFDSVTVDDFDNAPDTNARADGFGLGDVIRLAPNPEVEIAPYNGYVSSYDTDFIPFSLEYWNINAETEFLLSVTHSRSAGTSSYDNLELTFFNQALQKLHFEDLELLSGGSHNLHTNQASFYDAGTAQLAFKGGQWDGISGDQLSFGGADEGRFWLQIKEAPNVEEVSLALYEYVRLEEAGGIFNVSDYFQAKESAGYHGLYLAGLSGDETIIGSDYDEIFNGGAGADTLIGGGGNDVFIWGSGSFGDIIDGGAGDEDTIQLVGSSDLTSFTFSGIERLSSQAGDGYATISAEQFNSLSTFDALSVRLSTGAEVTIGDKLFINGAELSGSGVSVTSGNDANNNIVFLSGDNFYIGGSGNDQVSASSGDDNLSLGAGNDLVVDTGGDNIIDVADGNDEVTISASAGHNQISLGAGDDRLTLQGPVTSGSRAL